MEKVVVDASAAAKLDRTDGQVVIADSTGRMLGYFMQPSFFAQILTGRFDDEEPTQDEIEAAREDYRKHGGYTTEQVLAHFADLKRWSEEHGR